MDPKPEPKPKINTSCHDCRGEGMIEIALIAIPVATGIAQTAYTRKPCKTCDGKGTLPGFVIPM